MKKNSYILYKGHLYHKCEKDSHSTNSVINVDQSVIKAIKKALEKASKIALNTYCNNESENEICKCIAKAIEAIKPEEIKLDKGSAFWG